MWFTDESLSRKNKTFFNISKFYCNFDRNFLSFWSGYILGRFWAALAKHVSPAPGPGSARPLRISTVEEAHDYKESPIRAGKFFDKIIENIGKYINI